MLHRELLIDGAFLGGPCDQGTAKGIGKGLARSPYDGATIGTFAEAGWPECEAALDSASRAFATWRHSPRHERRTLLQNVACAVRDRHGELEGLLVQEVGKPVAWARGEVARLALTFDLAGGLLASWGHDAMPADYDPRGAGYHVRIERFPVGVVLAITPYNWPFNLAAHKIAPALAAGCTVVLKGSSQAPLCSLTLASLIHEAGCPPGALNAVQCPSSLAQKMALDPRTAAVSFTGSPEVGWRLKGLLPQKKVSLELGGDAFAVVHADAELDWAVARTVAGAFGYAGQVCIAVQHALVHDSIYAEARERMVAATRACPTGDPRDPETVCGPLISTAAADQVEEWIEEAIQAGARPLVRGSRQRALLGPTLLEDVPPQVRLGCQEVFGPVLTLGRYGELDEAIGRVNRSAYGLQTGVFTRDLRVAERAFREIETGAVVVDDFPTLRFDAMPYGGVKRSGFGREGLRYAMDDLTEPKAMVVRAR
jgi:acyl-CoA reductase-like NAD-dependent aldehyde dehydrogenase